jgi:hypothetical protein
MSGDAHIPGDRVRTDLTADQVEQLKQDFENDADDLGLTVSFQVTAQSNGLFTLRAHFARPTAAAANPPAATQPAAHQPAPPQAAPPAAPRPVVAPPPQVVQPPTASPPPGAAPVAPPPVAPPPVAPPPIAPPPIAPPPVAPPPVASPVNPTPAATPIPPPPVSPANPPPAIAAVPPPAALLCWGAKVSVLFRQKIRTIAANLRTDANFLMACMAFESGESFSPAKRNPVSGATGLIQFMPKTAEGLGTTTAALAAMTAEDQLDFVAKYFAGNEGKLAALSDVYMAILFPVAVGKPDDFVLFARNGPNAVAYQQNSGLDLDHDGRVTKAEAASKVADALARGFRPSNVA